MEMLFSACQAKKYCEVLSIATVAIPTQLPCIRIPLTFPFAHHLHAL